MSEEVAFQENNLSSTPGEESPKFVADTESPEPLLSDAGTAEEEENVATIIVNLSAENLSKEVDPEVEVSKPNATEPTGTVGTYPDEVLDTVEEDDGKKEEKKKAKPASLYKLFSYATPLDWFFMFIGTCASIAHGFALPAFTIIFGRFINTFVNQAFTQSLIPLFNLSTNVDIDCGDPGPFNPMYFGDIVSNITQGAINCDHVIMSNSTYTSVLRNCFSMQVSCLSNDDFIGDVNILVYVFIGVAVAVFTLGYFQISLFQAACERQVKKIRLAFYAAIMRQEIGWFDANSTGGLSSRLADDVDKIHDGIGDKVALLIQWVATFFGGFIVAFIEDYRLTLVLLASTPFLIMAGYFIAKFTTSFTSQEQKEYAAAGGVAEEVLSSIRTVVAFGGEKSECDRYDSKLKEARAIGAKKGAVVGFNLGFIFFLFFSIEGLAFWFGGYLISIEVIQGGDVLTVVFAVLIGAFALGQAGPNMQLLLTAAGAAGTIFEIIKRKSLIDPSSEEGETPEKIDSSIQFKGITFSYPTRPDIEVLKGFSLDIAVGKTYALVGASGCGKSTTIQLLQRFYDPSSGEVLVGGKDIRTLNIKWLRQHIGVVSQEPVLFDTTIAENILYGKDGATQEEVKEAAVCANAHDFISKLPDGYSTQVGEGGVQLSGGQKQRIAIARALIRDPKILLLDEATSALDTESESIVQQALDSARAGRTTIIIAHRLSTIQNADLIASIRDGKIVEMGTHSELMDKEGLYYDLVVAQSYEAGENFSKMLGSPKRLLSYRASHRSRHTSDGSDSNVALEKLTSLQHQTSFTTQSSKDINVAGQLLSQKKKQEEWDKEIPQVSFWRVIKENKKEWWIICIGVLAAAVNGAMFPSFSLFFGEILKVFQLPANQVLGEIHLWAALFIVLGLVSGVANIAKHLCFSVAGENLTSRLRSLSFKAVLRQEIGWFDEERNSSGFLTTRLADDAAKVQGVTGTRVGTLLETSIGMLMALIIAFVYSWVLTLLVLVVIPIVLIGGAAEVKALAGHTIQNKKSLEIAGKIAVESISNIRTVATLSLEENFTRQYTCNVQRPFRRAMWNTILYGVTYAFSQAVTYLLYPIVFRFGAFQITLPDDNLASSSFDKIIVVFFALIFGAAGAGQAGAFAPSYAKAKLSASRIFQLLDRVPIIDSYSEDGQKPEKVRGEVGTNNLHFNYPSRPAYSVLQGININIKSGHTLALVGPSGCGKSTVVSLLERFYDPLSGLLTLDSTNIADLNIDWLRRQIGIVSQEPVLFDRSIADNIRYGANFREVSATEVIEAAKAANIHNFVESLPQAYDTNVGSKGTQLSGGQKQRIAIARALIRDPKILLLDEATSALDTESEKVVQEALDRARKGRTSVVIAHRLSTIYNADCIAVISSGKVIESGTHTELMEKMGLYYKLNRYQVVEAKLPENS